MMATFNIGDSVYLSASPAVFDGMTGKTVPRERQGPFIIEKVYQSGQNWRLSAVMDNPYNYVDAAVSQFEAA